MRRLPLLLPALLCGLGLLACSSSPNKPAASPTGTTAGARSQTPAGGRTGSPPAGASKEVSQVSSVRPIIVRLVNALKQGDLAAAKTAYNDYDAAWNSIEVYINFRSRQLYGDLETDLQTKIEDALNGPQPQAAAIAPLAEQLLNKYDDAIKLVTAGPPLSPLFDDVATIRTLRANLRRVPPLLQQGDLAAARVSFQIFAQYWPGVQPLFRARSAEAEQQTSAALADATLWFRQTDATPAALMPFVTTLMDRYNFGLNLATAAARNANPAQVRYSSEQVAQVAALAAIDQQLTASLAAWDTSDYATAAQAARRADGDLFQPVQAPLQVKSADTALKQPLDAFAALAGVAGDKAKVHAAGKSAHEAVLVAEQAVAGQFWTDPAFQAELKAKGVV